MRFARIFLALPPALVAVLAAAAVTPAEAKRIPVREPDYAEPPPPQPYIPPTPEILYVDGPHCELPNIPPAPVILVKPRLWGLGIRASQLEPSNEGAPAGKALGAVLRLRTSAWTEVELDFGRAEYGESGEPDARRETRLGGTVYARLSRGQIAPYLLAGGGAYSIYSPQHDGGRDIYVEGGAGLALRMSEQLTITGDVRWTALHWLDGEDTDAASDATREGRLAAILYF